MFDVITIGTATRDVFLESKDFHVLSPGRRELQCFALGAKIEVDEVVFASGGGAANAAVTFARQGFKTACLFKTGNDEAGRSVRYDLEKEGVRPLLTSDSKKHTAYATVLLNPNGERTILTYRGAAESLELTEIPWGDLEARWACFFPSRIPLNAMEQLVNHFNHQGAFLAMNPSGHYLKMGIGRLLPLLNKLKVIIMNEEEAGLSKIDDVFAGILAVTKGPRGIRVKADGRIYEAGVFPETAVADRTGAGDAFGAGFVAGLMQSSNDIEYAIRLGSANATSVVEHIGAQTGILNRREFEENRRWQKLPIHKKSVKH